MRRSGKQSGKVQESGGEGGASASRNLSPDELTAIERERAAQDQRSEGACP